MTEDHETRLRRLRIRSWRRGIKEMDLILGGYFDAHHQTLGATTLDLYEALLEENDHDLYRWVSGQEPAPARLAALLDEISRFVGTRRA